MKKTIVYILLAVLLAGIACACGDDLGIKRNYEFEVVHLPVQKRIKKGEVAEIRFQLVRSGFYQGAKYHLRYFQPDGKGELRMEDRTLLLPNDLYDLPKETFRMYYTSRSEDRQVIDLYFLDNFNNLFTLSFSFNNESDEEEISNSE